MKEILNASTAHTGQRQWREMLLLWRTRRRARGATTAAFEARLLRPGRGGWVIWTAAGRGDHPRSRRPYEGTWRGSCGAGEGGAHPAVHASEAVVRGLRRRCAMLWLAWAPRSSPSTGRSARRPAWPCVPSALPTMRPIPTGSGSTRRGKQVAIPRLHDRYRHRTDKAWEALPACAFWRWRANHDARMLRWAPILTSSSSASRRRAGTSLNDQAREALTTWLTKPARGGGHARLPGEQHLPAPARHLEPSSPSTAFPRRSLVAFQNRLVTIG